MVRPSTSLSGRLHVNLRLPLKEPHRCDVRVENTLTTHRDSVYPKSVTDGSSKGRVMSSKAGLQQVAPQSGNQLAVEPIKMPFREGDIVAGKYEIIQLIGTGGMG